ncbi:hypothetical protein [Hyalangium gracile]|nr:hypothetical protein [Hyalangium gracile]
MTNFSSRIELTQHPATCRGAVSRVQGFVRVALVAVLLVVHGSGPPF